MKFLHKNEKDQFKKLFRQENIDRFDDRLKILDVFLQTERHITVSELQQLLTQEGHDFDMSFVKDTLGLLCHYGFAEKNRFEDGKIRYEHRHLNQHHDHMICTKCNTISEFRDDQLEKLQEKIAAAHGFHMLQHRMEIYGICGNCLKESVQLMPLVLAKPGERLRIMDFRGGATSRMRLMTMGLRPGDVMEVITNHGQGQVVVAVDFKRYVLGRGLAQKILVEPIN